MHRPPRIITAGVILATLPAARSSSAGISRAELLERPPFAAPASVPGNTSAGIEFTGVFGAGDTVEVSLRETGGRAVWVRLHDPQARHYVESLNEDGDEITVILSGLRVRIPLKKSAAGGRSSEETETFVRADGKVWSLPKDGEGRHPDDPGNAD